MQSKYGIDIYLLSFLATARRLVKTYCWICPIIRIVKWEKETLSVLVPYVWIRLIFVVRYYLQKYIDASVLLQVQLQSMYAMTRVTLSYNLQSRHL